MSILNYIKQSSVSLMLLASIILTSGLILNVLQVMQHLCVKTFSKIFFHKTMYFISWTWFSLLVFIMDYWSNSQLILYCSNEDYSRLGTEHNLILINHSYEIDFMVMWWFLEKNKTLGCGRCFVKDATKYIPIFGWFFNLHGNIFLERSFEKDRKVIEKNIARYMEYPTSTSITLTAEGTRFTKEKHETSINFAKEKNVEPFKHHLIPRPGGFNLCVPLLKKYKCPALYNLQIAFDNNATVKPTLGNLLLGKKVVAHVYLERIPMENVEPTFEFLYKVYKKKDALQDSFQKHGNFFEGQGEKKIEGRIMPRRPQVLINSLVWMTIVFLLMLYYAVKLILAGNFFILIAVGGIMIGMCKYFHAAFILN
jgi:lysophosphatidic acid acyltransferase / lysophosphatidylinositol acyltransferase